MVAIPRLPHQAVNLPPSPLAQNRDRHRERQDDACDPSNHLFADLLDPREEFYQWKAIMSYGKVPAGVPPD